MSCFRSKRRYGKRSLRPSSDASVADGKASSDTSTAAAAKAVANALANAFAKALEAVGCQS